MHREECFVLDFLYGIEFVILLIFYPPCRPVGATKSNDTGQSLYLDNTIDISSYFCDKSISLYFDDNNTERGK